MTKPDATFTSASLFGSEKWCAARLGKSQSWFMDNRRRLETAGFPKRDPIIGLRPKADVDAWVERRRQYSGRVEAPINHKPEVNINAL